MEIKVQLMDILDLLVVNSHVLAEKAELSSWKSSVELAYVGVSGNTNTETTKVAFDVSYESSRWLHKLHTIEH